VEVIFVEMKLFVIALLVAFVGLSYGAPKAGIDTRTEAELKQPARKFPYELPGLNPLCVHSLNSCCKNGNNAKPIRAWMGPCYCTEQCQIPHCCGIISGRNSTFKIEYEAVTEFEGGIFNGNLGGFGLGPESDGRNCTPITLPIQITVPNFLPGYSHDLCKQTICPQKRGEIHTLTIPFRFITTAITTFGIKADFVAEIITKKKTTTSSLLGSLCNT